jgi:hypothetical protein
MRIIKRITVAFSISLTLSASAQQQPGTDSLYALKQFIQISNSYKQLPMHAIMQIQNSSDFVSNTQDTASTQAEFYLSQHGSYVKTSEMEQLSDDSLMVLVNNGPKRIIVLPNKQSVEARIKDYMGIQLADSSLEKAARKYTAAILPTENGIAAIELTSRELAYGSTMPKEQILIRYNASTQKPLALIQSREKLVKIDSAQYAVFTQNPQYKNKLLAPQKQGRQYYFLLKSQALTYTYKKMESGNSIQQPVHISDRIQKNSNGDYAPAKGYEAFIVKKQNF